MSLIQLIIVLVVMGVLLWAINQYVPMQPPIKTILNIVVIIVICLWLLAAFGILSGGFLSRPIR